MINWKSILSSFNDKPTLLEWLKLVEKALKESVLTSVTTEQDANKENTKLIFNFEDGTQIDTGFFPTKGKDAAEITGATSLYIGTTNGLSKSRVTFSKNDNRSFYADILAKAGKAVESFTSAVKEVTDENTVNTITVNYDDKTSNTFDVSSARGKQGATGATGATGPKGATGATGPKGADGVSITEINTVSDEVVGDETHTTLRAHYSNNTTDDFVVTAKNGSLSYHKYGTVTTDNNDTIYLDTYDSSPDINTLPVRTLYGQGYYVKKGSSWTYYLCLSINIKKKVDGLYLSFEYLTNTSSVFSSSAKITDFNLMVEAV